MEQEVSSLVISLLSCQYRRNIGGCCSLNFFIRFLGLLYSLETLILNTRTSKTCYLVIFFPIIKKNLKMFFFVIRHPFLSGGFSYFLIEILNIKILFGQKLVCASRRIKGSRRIKSESNGSSVGYVLAIRYIKSFIRTGAASLREHRSLRRFYDLNDTQPFTI